MSLYNALKKYQDYENEIEEVEEEDSSQEVDSTDNNDKSPGVTPNATVGLNTARSGINTGREVMATN